MSFADPNDFDFTEDNDAEHEPPKFPWLECIVVFIITAVLLWIFK